MDEPRIVVTEHGPYRVEGPVAIHDVDGEARRRDGVWHLCRCGGSRNKPFCDVTHGLKGFDGTEKADHTPIARRREAYPTDGDVTVYDDRTRCAHFGQCTDRLPAVFRSAEEPFVDPQGAPPEQIADVVSGCPSGALAFARGHDPTPVEVRHAPSIRPIVDGPYRVRGGVEVVGADGRPYERRERQPLCRCGHSGNKPFCDGSHWYAGFRDPLPPELEPTVPTLYEAIGGIEALEALTERFYSDLLGEPDPVLEPVFRGMDSEHPRHVAAWLGETFGGPPTFTESHGGYEHMLAKHRGLDLTETQRRRWIDRMIDTADAVGLSTAPGLRAALVAYLEWGTRLAVINSAPGAAVIEHAPVPQWGWAVTPVEGAQHHEVDVTDPDRRPRVLMVVAQRRYQVTIASPDTTTLPADTPAVGDLDLRLYDALVVCGGQGPMFQFRGHEALGAAIVEFVESRRPTAALCHGTCALLDPARSDGRPLIEGRTMTGVANVEEDYSDTLVGRTVMPFRIEDDARASGPFVVRDMSLITGQQQYSGRAVAEAVIRALGD